MLFPSHLAMSFPGEAPSPEPICCTSTGASALFPLGAQEVSAARTIAAPSFQAFLIFAIDFNMEERTMG